MTLIGSGGAVIDADGNKYALAIGINRPAGGGPAVTIDGLTITGNAPIEPAIWSKGHLTVRDSRIVRNGDGGVHVSGADLLIEDTSVSRNGHTGVGGSGYAGGQFRGALTIRDSEISRNDGDGVIWSLGPKLIVDSVVSRNARNGIAGCGLGGAVIIQNVRVVRNAGMGVWCPVGGGLLPGVQVLRVEDSLIADNSTSQSDGGGINFFISPGGSGGPLPIAVIRDTTIRGNDAPR